MYAISLIVSLKVRSSDSTRKVGFAESGRSGVPRFGSSGSGASVAWLPWQAPDDCILPIAGEVRWTVLIMLEVLGQGHSQSTVVRLEAG
jgi:hypothetical protein